MLATYRLMLADDENLLNSLFLAPWLSYLLLFGAAYGVFRWALDMIGYAVRGFARPAKAGFDPGAPESPYSRGGSTASS